MNTTCRRCKNNFVIDENDQTFYQKMKVPNPTECPDCRFMCRAMWRNETTLYSRTCDMCQKNIISMYNPKSPYVVYCYDCYKGDTWDTREYAQHYDISKSFFEQLRELFYKTPKNALYLTLGAGPLMSSPYNNCVGGLKNCYFTFNSSVVEDSGYCRGITYSKEVFDSYFGIKLDQCYEIINCQNSNKLFFSQNSKNCVDSYFLYNCTNCINCFGCINQQNKSYFWFNEQLTKEEYEQKISRILGSNMLFDSNKKKFEDFKKSFPHRLNTNMSVVDCIGDYITESKNIQYSFEIIKGEDSKWNFGSREIKDSYGTIGYGIKSEMLLECVSTGYVSRGIGCYSCELSQNIEYSFSCLSSNHDIFGCDGISNGEYMILNKQYTKEEYENLRTHIINELTHNGDYGLMLPPELSPFGYNETIGNDNMKLSKDEALKLGFKWQDDIQKTVGKETIQSENLEDNIADTPDSITKEILTCIDCSRNYKIIEQELFFYRRMKLPIPRKCFFCRHHDRIEKRGPYKFWNRNCALCKKDIVTNYAPEKPEIVYCEECYRREVL